MSRLPGVYIFFVLALVLLLASSVRAGEQDAYERIASRSVPSPEAVLEGEQDLPVMINVGISTCPPCRTMASVLLDLKQDYQHVFSIHYYDMHKHENVEEKFDIRIVPTQVFYASDGRELFRHEGYISDQNILKQWQELGYEVQPREEPRLDARDWFSLEFVLSYLSQAMQGAPLTAMLAAFVWGMLSIVLSPCHLASIPLIIAYINRRKLENTSRALVLSLLFALGILTTILVIGVITAWAGRILGDLGPLPYYLVSAVFILFGLNLIGLITMQWSLSQKIFPSEGNKKGAMLLGMIIGVGLGPCTFMFLAPMLGLTFALSATDQLFGILLLLTFAVAHCFLLVLAGISPSFLKFFLRWNELSLASMILKKVSGILLLLGGAYLLLLTI